MVDLVRSPILVEGGALNQATRGTISLSVANVSIAKITRSGFDAKEEQNWVASCGFDSPPGPSQVVRGKAAIAWLSPRERLVVGEAEEVQQMLEAAKQTFSSPTLAYRVDSQFSCIKLEGVAAPDVLSSLMPIDFRQDRFGPGSCTRSLLGETRVMVETMNGHFAYRIYAAQSSSQYVWDILSDACDHVRS